MIKLKQLIESISLNESTHLYTMYSGITKSAWNDIWKNKKLINKPTNVTSDISFASDYSYNFETGDYEDTIVEIQNIPIDAFIGYRKNNYKNDSDYKSMIKLSIEQRIDILENYELFLVNLYPCKSTIRTKLVKFGM